MSIHNFLFKKIKMGLKKKTYISIFHNKFSDNQPSTRHINIATVLKCTLHWFGVPAKKHKYRLPKCFSPSNIFYYLFLLLPNQHHISKKISLETSTFALQFARSASSQNWITITCACTPPRKLFVQANPKYIFRYHPFF